MHLCTVFLQHARALQNKAQRWISMIRDRLHISITYITKVNLTFFFFLREKLVAFERWYKNWEIKHLEANSINPDEAAHIEPPRQDLPFFNVGTRHPAESYLYWHQVQGPSVTAVASIWNYFLVCPISVCSLFDIHVDWNNASNTTNQTEPATLCFQPYRMSSQF